MSDELIDYLEAAARDLPLEQFLIAMRSKLSGLALVPAADVPTPISDETLRHLRECALAWEPEARVIGDVTAHQLRSFCLELARLRAAVSTPEERAAFACDECCAHGCEDGHCERLEDTRA